MMIASASLWAHFKMGGWVMWPIFAFGLLAVGAAGRFAWRGEHQLVGFIRWLLCTILASGAFGFVVGTIKSISIVEANVSPERRTAVLLLGMGESANNLSAALLFTVIVCLLTAVGHRRFPLPNPSAVAR